MWITVPLSMYIYIYRYPYICMSIWLWKWKATSRKKVGMRNVFIGVRPKWQWPCPCRQALAFNHQLEPPLCQASRLCGRCRLWKAPAADLRRWPMAVANQKLNWSPYSSHEEKKLSSSLGGDEVETWRRVIRVEIPLAPAQKDSVPSYLWSSRASLYICAPT